MKAYWAAGSGLQLLLFCRHGRVRFQPTSPKLVVYKFGHKHRGRKGGKEERVQIPTTWEEEQLGETWLSPREAWGYKQRSLKLCVVFSVVLETWAFGSLLTNESHKKHHQKRNNLFFFF